MNKNKRYTVESIINEHFKIERIQFTINQNFRCQGIIAKQFTSEKK